METITVQELSKISLDEITVLDVRTQCEYDLVNIKSQLIPLDELESRYSELDKSKTIYCLCHHGVRSEFAAMILKSKGFKSVNILGGIDAWSLYVDSSVQRY